MKLFSTNRNSMGKQLVCDDAVFDPTSLPNFTLTQKKKSSLFNTTSRSAGTRLTSPSMRKRLTSL